MPSSPSSRRIERTDPHYGIYVALAIGTVVLSWTFIHTIFALHYAHEFYGAGAHKNGLRFPGDGQPDYWDFIYFSFVIGMTFQVSDVAVTHKSVRRTVVAPRRAVVFLHHRRGGDGREHCGQHHSEIDDP